MQGKVQARDVPNVRILLPTLVNMGVGMAVDVGGVNTGGQELRMGKGGGHVVPLMSAHRTRYWS